ncbi:exonuclease domain-containing protein [Streptomyces sviceus]|uniref:3'-5' exonuclease n=1 Tax=Streptomyces sviceus TaxID=285530 RepID=UPI003697C270
MDTLVKPAEPTEPISDGACWIHGITDEMVAGARPFEQILPRLRQVTKGKVICIYNADFDRGVVLVVLVVLGDVRRAGKRPMHLEPCDSWCSTMGLLVQPQGGVQGVGRLLPVASARRPLPRARRLRIGEEGVDPDVRGPRLHVHADRARWGAPVAGPPSGTALAVTALPAQGSDPKWAQTDPEPFRPGGARPRPPVCGAGPSTGEAKTHQGVLHERPGRPGAAANSHACWTSPS